MKKIRTTLQAIIISFCTVFSASAGTRVVIDVEVIEGDSIEKSTEIITFDERRFRIDLPGVGGEVTDQTSYIMSVNVPLYQRLRNCKLAN